MTVPAKLTAKSLTKGFGLKVKVGAAGKVTITATVKRVVIATGSATAKGAGIVTVKLKLNAAGRKARKRLKGKKATLRITQGEPQRHEDRDAALGDLAHHHEVRRAGRAGAAARRRARRARPAPAPRSRAR